jgi:hypothetical protein
MTPGTDRFSGLPWLMVQPSVISRIVGSSSSALRRRTGFRNPGIPEVLRRLLARVLKPVRGRFLFEVSGSPMNRGADLKA